MIPRLTLRAPGLFITSTDTSVGKTTITCAIASFLRSSLPSARVGVFKPMATGCRQDREGLVSEDAEALAHFSNTRFPLHLVNPIRYLPPVAPAVAAQMTGVDVDWDELARALRLIDQSSDFLLVEGAGGLLVPVDRQDPKLTMLDLALAIGYPVVVVTRATLGTLNHTAMTVRLLQQKKCPVAGIVINGYEPDAALQTDPSMSANREWLQKMNKVPILAVVPKVDPSQVQPHLGKIPPAILETVALTYWPDVAGGRELGAGAG